MPMPLDFDTVNCFTDGSKTENGSGYVYLIMSHDLKTQEFTHLGKHATVFQSEIFATSGATQTMLTAGITEKPIHFHIDSQSTGPISPRT